MRKRGLILLFAVLFLFSACGTAPAEQDDGKTTLTLMGRKEEMEKDYMQRIFQLYEQNGNCRLNVIAVDDATDASYDEAVQEAFSSGNAPDILFHNNNSGLHALNEKAQFVCLDEEAWVSDLTDGAKAYCQNSEGELIGLPFWENSLSGCYYNKTILDSLGLRPAATQEEFDALCQALQSIGYTPMCWSFRRCKWNYQFALDPIFADDPELLRRLNKNEITYADIPEVRDMLEWLVDADKKGWFGEDYAERDWEDISHALVSGECVMINIWDTWFDTDLEEGGTYSKEDFALMPVFMNTEPSGTYEGGNLNMMMVNKQSGHVEEALEFLSFCAQSDNYNQAFDGISTVNCFKGQTTNIQSRMVTDAQESIALHERASTANPKILGYSQQAMAEAVQKLLEGEVDVSGCIALMDESRIAAARELGAEGF
ncbi:MAG: ABC transporter substrate-binding protein [Blautia sp.]|nr:ABC transporter substrate-binding protein [Blautia sp.]